MTKFYSLILGLGFLLVVGCSNNKSITGKSNPVSNENIAYFWGKVALDATANDTERFSPRPTITSRYLGLIFTAVFDAISVYDPNAKPVYHKNQKKIKGGFAKITSWRSFSCMFLIVSPNVFVCSILGASIP